MRPTQHDGADGGSVLADTLQEVVNLGALKENARAGTDRRPGGLAAYVARCEREGRPVPGMAGGFVAVPVQYYRKHALPGRRYPVGMAAQFLTREARAVAFSPHALDFDMNNCHASLLLHFVEKSGSGGHFKTLRRFVHNVGAWRAMVSDYCGISLKEAKRELVKICYMGAPAADLPMLWALASEVRAAADLLLRDQAFSHLHGYFGDRTNPKATRLAYALFSLEDQALEDMCQAVAAMNRGSVFTYMYDGAVVSADGAGTDRLTETLNNVGDLHGVSVKVAHFAAA